MIRIKLLAVAVALAAGLGLLAVGQAATATPNLSPARPAAAVACTKHQNLSTSSAWSTSAGITVYSTDAWSRTLYAWDSCAGGSEWVVSFDADCHIRVRLWSIHPDGSVYGNGNAVADRGGTCNARPGKWTKQRDGSTKTWSGAGTQLSATPYQTGPLFVWKASIEVGWGREGVGQRANSSQVWVYSWFSAKWQGF